jgi:hypothetical protein
MEKRKWVNQLSKPNQRTKRTNKNLCKAPKKIVDDNNLQ